MALLQTEREERPETLLTFCFMLTWFCLPLLGFFSQLVWVQCLALSIRTLLAKENSFCFIYLKCD